MNKLIYSLNKPLFIIALTLSFNTLAQSPIRLKIEAGYGLGMPTSSYLLVEDQIFFTNFIFDEIQTAGGLQLGASIGSELTQSIRLSAQFHYQKTGNQVYRSYPAYPNPDNPTELLTSENIYSLDYQTISFSPLITFIISDIDFPFKPFASIGPTMILSGQNERTADFYDAQENQNISSVSIDQFSLSFGARASLGFERNINKDFAFQVSAQIRCAYLEPSSYKLTKYYVDGEDKLQSLSVQDREGVYRNELNQPQQSFHPELAWIGADLMLGIVYKL